MTGYLVFRLERTNLPSHVSFHCVSTPTQVLKIAALIMSGAPTITNQMHWQYVPEVLP